MSSVNMSVLSKKLQNLALLKATVTTQAFTFFQKLTPIAPKNGGNARRSTTLNKNKIQATYPYASVLDAGRGHRDGQMRGSTQAPKGMSGPTALEIKKLVKTFIATVGRK